MFIIYEVCLYLLRAYMKFFYKLKNPKSLNVEKKKSHIVFSDSAMGFLCKMNFFTLAVLPTLPRFQQVSAKHARILWYRPTLPSLRLVPVQYVFHNFCHL